jgi:uncharacterized protein (UPF0147 family)
MTPVDYVAGTSLLFALLATGLAAVEKLPWVKKHPQVLGWITEADAIAGQLRLALPPGTTVAQAKAAATTEAAALVVKYAGGPTQAEAVGQIMGTLGSIVQDGHILPANVAPAASDVMAELAKIQELLKVATPVAPPIAAPFADPNLLTPVT